MVSILFYFLKELLYFYYLFIYLFIFGCVGSSFLCEGFLQLRQAGATPHRGAQASHYRGLSCCGAQAPDAQAQQPWLTGLVAPRHVGSSQTRARTRVPCISKRTLNRCATREVPIITFDIRYSKGKPWIFLSIYILECTHWAPLKRSVGILVGITLNYGSLDHEQGIFFHF